MTTNNSKQAGWVAIGSFFSFAVGIISPMILSRYFDKGDYGTYKQVMYVYNTLLAIFTLGLPRAYAYFIPKFEIRYSRDIINKITRIFFILGSVLSLFLFFASGIIADFLNNPDLKTAMMLFAPAPLFLLPTIGMDGIYAAFRKTKFLAFYTISTRVLTISCIILPVVIFDGNYIYAIIGFDIASFITCAIGLYMKTLPIKGVEQTKSSLRFKQILDFSLPLLYASIWGMIIASANQFFISRYYGNEVFAEFSNGFMEIPFCGMIISAVGAILLPVLSRIDKGHGMGYEALNIWDSAVSKSAKLIIPILIFSIIFSKLFVTCMYGDQYENSSYYFMIKNISGLLYIIPFAPIILSIGKTKVYANVHMYTAILIVALDWIIVYTFDSAIYIAIVSELCQAFKILLLMKIIADYSSKSVWQLFPKKTLAHILLVSSISAVVAYFLIQLFPMNKFTMLLLGCVIYSAIYYSLCWTTSLSYRNIVKSFIENSKYQSLIKIIP